MLSLGRLRRWGLGISSAEVSFARFGLKGEEGVVRAQMQQVVDCFLEGYHTALEQAQPTLLAARLDAMPADLRGFAYEGAALGLTVLDLLMPWSRSRFQALLQGVGEAHDYMMHVGAGLALGRLPFSIGMVLRRLNPFLCWLALDGYGFYEGFTRLRLRVERHQVPGRLLGYARQAFDVGLGRSLWFIEGGDVARVAATIDAFPPVRHGELWSGVGLACSYTGWVDHATVVALREAAGAYRPQLAQGATFSARARQRASNPTAATDMACRVLCGLTAQETAAVAEAALEDLPADEQVPAFEIWRQRILAHFAVQGGEGLPAQTHPLQQAGSILNQQF